jgi:small subunit ribosomal protein S16
LTDSKNSTKSGRYLEVLGSHDSRHKDKTTINADRVKYWMSQGAQVSETVHNMLVSNKIVSGKKVNVLPKKSPIKKEEEAPKA